MFRHTAASFAGSNGWFTRAAQFRGRSTGRSVVVRFVAAPSRDRWAATPHHGHSDPAGLATAVRATSARSRPLAAGADSTSVGDPGMFV